MANCSAAGSGPRVVAAAAARCEGGTTAAGTAAPASTGAAAAEISSAPGTRAQPQRSPLPAVAAEGDGGGMGGGEGAEEATVEGQDSGTAHGAAAAAAAAAATAATAATATAAAATTAAIATTAIATRTAAAPASSEDDPPRHLYCASLLRAQRCFDERGDWRLAWTDEADDKLAELLRRFHFDFASAADALATWVRIERKWAVRVGLLSARECRLRWVELDRHLAAHCEGASCTWAS